MDTDSEGEESSLISESLLKIKTYGFLSSGFLSSQSQSQKGKCIQSSQRESSHREGIFNRLSLQRNRHGITNRLSPQNCREGTHNKLSLQRNISSDSRGLPLTSPPLQTAGKQSASDSRTQHKLVSSFNTSASPEVLPRSRGEIASISSPEQPVMHSLAFASRKGRHLAQVASKYESGKIDETSGVETISETDISQTDDTGSETDKKAGNRIYSGLKLLASTEKYKTPPKPFSVVKNLELGKNQQKQSNIVRNFELENSRPKQTSVVKNPELANTQPKQSSVVQNPELANTWPKHSSVMKNPELGQNQQKQSNNVRNLELEVSQPKQTSVVKNPELDNSQSKQSSVVRTPELANTWPKHSSVMKNPELGQNQQKQPNIVRNLELENSRPKQTSVVKNPELGKNQQKQSSVVQNPELANTWPKHSSVMKNPELGKNQHKQSNIVRNLELENSRPKQTSVVKNPELDNSQPKQSSVVRNPELGKVSESVPVKTSRYNIQTRWQTVSFENDEDEIEEDCLGSVSTASEATIVNVANKLSSSSAISAEKSESDEELLPLPKVTFSSRRKSEKMTQWSHTPARSNCSKLTVPGSVEKSCHRNQASPLQLVKSHSFNEDSSDADIESVGSDCDEGDQSDLEQQTSILQTHKKSSGQKPSIHLTTGQTEKEVNSAADENSLKKVTQQVENSTVVYEESTAESLQTSGILLNETEYVPADCADGLGSVIISDVKSVDPRLFWNQAENVIQTDLAETSVPAKSSSDNVILGDNANDSLDSKSNISLNFSSLDSESDWTQPCEQADHGNSQIPPLLSQIRGTSISGHQVSDESLPPPLLTKISSSLLPSTSCSVPDSSSLPESHAPSLAVLKRETEGSEEGVTKPNFSQNINLSVQKIKTEKVSPRQSFSVTVLTLPQNDNAASLQTMKEENDLARESFTISVSASGNDAGQMLALQEFKREITESAEQMSITIPRQFKREEGEPTMETMGTATVTTETVNEVAFQVTGLKREIVEPEETATVDQKKKMETGASLQVFRECSDDTDSDRSQCLFDDLPKGKPTAGAQEMPEEDTQVPQVYMSDAEDQEDFTKEPALEGRLLQSKESSGQEPKPCSPDSKSGLFSTEGRSVKITFHAVSKPSVSCPSSQLSADRDVTMTGGCKVEVADNDVTITGGCKVEDADSDVTIAGGYTMEDTDSDVTITGGYTVEDDLIVVFDSDEEEMFSSLTQVPIKTENNEETDPEELWSDTAPTAGGISDIIDIDADEDNVMDLSDEEIQSGKNPSVFPESILINKHIEEHPNDQHDMYSLATQIDDLNEDSDHENGIMSSSSNCDDTRRYDVGISDSRDSEDQTVNATNGMDKALHETVSSKGHEMAASVSSQLRVGDLPQKNERARFHNTHVAHESLPPRKKQTARKSLQSTFNSDLSLAKLADGKSQQTSACETKHKAQANLQGVSAHQGINSKHEAHHRMDCPSSTRSGSSGHSLSTDTLDMTLKSNMKDVDNFLSTFEDDILKKQDKVEGEQMIKKALDSYTKARCNFLYDAPTLMEEECLDADIETIAAGEQRNCQPDSVENIVCNLLAEDRERVSESEGNETENELYFIATQRDHDPYFMATQIDFEPHLESDVNLATTDRLGKRQKQTHFVTESASNLEKTSLSKKVIEHNDNKSTILRKSDCDLTAEEGRTCYGREERTVQSNSILKPKTVTGKDIVNESADVQKILKKTNNSTLSSSESFQIAREKMIKIKSRNNVSSVIQIEPQPDRRHRRKGSDSKQKLLETENLQRKLCVSSSDTFLNSAKSRQSSTPCSSVTEPQSPGTNWLNKKPECISRKVGDNITKAHQSRKRAPLSSDKELSSFTKKAREDMKARQMKAIINPPSIGPACRREANLLNDPDVNTDVELPDTQEIFDKGLPILTADTPVSKQRLLKKDEAATKYSFTSDKSAIAKSSCDKSAEEVSNCDKFTNWKTRIVEKQRKQVVRRVSAEECTSSPPKYDRKSVRCRSEEKMDIEFYHESRKEIPGEKSSSFLDRNGHKQSTRTPCKTGEAVEIAAEENKRKHEHTEEEILHQKKARPSGSKQDYIKKNHRRSSLNVVSDSSPRDSSLTSSSEPVHKNSTSSFSKQSSCTRKNIFDKFENEISVPSDDNQSDGFHSKERNENHQSKNIADAHSGGTSRPLRPEPSKPKLSGSSKPASEAHKRKDSKTWTVECKVQKDSDGSVKKRHKSAADGHTEKTDLKHVPKESGNSKKLGRSDKQHEASKGGRKDQCRARSTGSLESSLTDTDRIKFGCENSGGGVRSSGRGHSGVTKEITNVIELSDKTSCRSKSDDEKGAKRRSSADSEHSNSDPKESSHWRTGRRDSNSSATAHCVSNSGAKRHNSPLALFVSLDDSCLLSEQVRQQVSQRDKQVSQPDTENTCKQQAGKIKSTVNILTPQNTQVLKDRPRQESFAKQCRSGNDLELPTKTLMHPGKLSSTTGKLSSSSGGIPSSRSAEKSVMNVPEKALQETQQSSSLKNCNSHSHVVANRPTSSRKTVRFNTDIQVKGSSPIISTKETLPSFAEILAQKSTSANKQINFSGNNLQNMPPHLQETRRQQTQDIQKQPAQLSAVKSSINTQKNTAHSGLKENVHLLRNLLSSEDFVNHVLQWPLKWLPEYENHTEKTSNVRQDCLPPIFDRSNQLYPMVTSYGDEIEEYQQICFRLLLLETWESIFQHWKQKKQKFVECKAFLTEASRPQTIISLQWTGLLTSNEVRNHEHPLENDIVEIDMFGRKLPENASQHFNGLSVGKEEKSSQLALVEKMQITRCQDVRELLRKHQQLQTHPALQGKDSDLYTFTISVKVRYRKFAPSKERLISIKNICSLSTALRQFMALKSLPRSPLMSQILQPSLAAFSHDTRIPTDFRTLNEEQSRAVSAVLTAVSQPVSVPKICLLQGPPGTGKSTVIVGLIINILQQMKNARICLAAPSNAAVDELLRRLVRKIKEHKLKYSVVRIGRADNVHSEVKEYMLDHKMKKAKEEVLHKKKMQVVPDPVKAESKRLQKKITAMMKKFSELEKQNKYAEAGGLQKELRNLRKKYDVLIKQMNENSEHIELTAEEIATIYRGELKSPHVICGTLSSFGQQRIIRTLCYNSEQKRFNNSHFTCVIIDEATQALELDSLIPLQYGTTKLLMVGDPNQLPPTVLSTKAQNLNYGLSLFERLYNHFQDEGGRNPVMLLNTQYRMDPQICHFPNHYIYNSQLKTHQKIKQNCEKYPLQPYVVFDIEEGQELLSQSGTVSNEIEAECTAVLCEELIQPNLHILASSIGIICPYSGQKRLVIRKLLDRGITGVEVNTVDGFQGREKHIIILSCVRARSSTGSIGFMADKRRMNVALTRAKYALYIIGHLQSLQTDEDWKALICDAEQKGHKVTQRVHNLTEFPSIIKQRCLKPKFQPKSHSNAWDAADLNGRGCSGNSLKKESSCGKAQVKPDIEEKDGCSRLNEKDHFTKDCPQDQSRARTPPGSCLKAHSDNGCNTDPDSKVSYLSSSPHGLHHRPSAGGCNDSVDNNIKICDTRPECYSRSFLLPTHFDSSHCDPVCEPGRDLYSNDPRPDPYYKKHHISPLPHVSSNCDPVCEPSAECDLYSNDLQSDPYYRRHHWSPLPHVSSHCDSNPYGNDLQSDPYYRRHHWSPLPHVSSHCDSNPYGNDLQSDPYYRRHHWSPLPHVSSHCDSNPCGNDLQSDPYYRRHHWSLLPHFSSHCDSNPCGNDLQSDPYYGRHHWSPLPRVSSHCYPVCELPLGKLFDECQHLHSENILLQQSALHLLCLCRLQPSGDSVYRP